MRSLLLVLLLVLGLPYGAAVSAEVRPIVIAHRGASGERPEHTRSAYLLAIEQGADFIEPDLVMTSDGVLVVRHENEISETTDVADHPEFAARKATRTIDGQAVTGWFTEDFTLAELKTLRAKERLPQLRPDSTRFDGRDEILTFAEVVAIAREGTARTGRTIGVYPELKHPAHFRERGFDPETALVEALRAAGWTGRDAPVFVQCFEVGPLERLRPRLGVRLVQLMSAQGGPADRPDLTYAALASPAGLKRIAAYADAIGVEKAMIAPRNADNRGLPVNMLVADAKAAGLMVHVWTFRAENYFLAEEQRRGVKLRPDYLRLHGDLESELKGFYALGVDGVFSDFPGVAAKARP